ncbi:transposase [Streptomyces sp. NPDC085540]|uniref:transposase n=1 Tax=Streptomyces sp. NPDC085540 TaxID=3365730 RepID=UPI0037CDBAE8
MLDAIRYLVNNGTKWRAMPADFPLWGRVYAFFRRWHNHDLVREFHDRLHRLVREWAGRDSEPGAGVIESQSVKADAVVGPDSRGFNGGKLINGRKRHVVVDTLGLLLAVMVTAADVGDRAAAQVLLTQVTAAHHLLALVWPTADTPAASSSTACGPRPGPRHRQTQRRHARLRRAAQAVDRRAVLRPPDAKSPSRARLRVFHRQRGGDGLLVDDDAHDPPRCPATSFASVNRPGAGSISQPHVDVGQAGDEVGPRRRGRPR